MKTEEYRFIACNGTELPAAIWTPDSQPKAVLQIAHGMTEHIGRYDKLAEALTMQGIVVAGFDLRGHGQNPGDAHIASWGESGEYHSLKDMHLFYFEMQKRYPGIPHYMLGFSLGSFLLRNFFDIFDNRIDGAIFIGTGQTSEFILKIMCTIVKSQIGKSGFDSTTPLVQKLSFETYNQKFQPSRTPFDWLCADEAQLDKYISDELCREHISSGLFLELLYAMRATRRCGCRYWRKDMPVLLISGQDDPVGDFGKGVQRVEAAMRKAGLKNVQMKFFPGARHDLLHEEANGSAEEARKLITKWIDNLLA